MHTLRYSTFQELLIKNSQYIHRIVNITINTYSAYINAYRYKYKFTIIESRWGPK